jgi:hypothetical protein
LRHHSMQSLLYKLHGRMPSNLGGMYVILHFGKSSIHNLSVMGTIEVPGLGRLISQVLDGPPLRVATNSLKSGLFILRRTSNCSGWIGPSSVALPHFRAHLDPRGFLSSSSPIDSSRTTQSSTGSSNMVSCPCLRFFLGAIQNSQEVNRAQPGLWYHMTRPQVPC